MPWKEVSRMVCRKEFVLQATAEGSNISALCQSYGISRKTAYKWLRRFAAHGLAGLSDQHRRPLASPGRTEERVEELIVKLRRQHPAWGGRKLRWRLLALGQGQVPSASTITEILRRHGLLSAEEAVKHKPVQRFEHAHPNDLWQMDFKGHFALSGVSERCHPLTVLDDHSRYALKLCACANETEETVRGHLGSAFEEYGLPHRMLTDNGSPWGTSGGDKYTSLSVWLLRLGVGVVHGRAYHPQTQGKDERFHRTIVAEVLSGMSFADLIQAQRQFDEFRTVYNCERPHEALGMEVPARRYQPSFRRMPSKLPDIEYNSSDVVRKVQQDGKISYRGQYVMVSKAFRGERVALRATTTEGVLEIFFCAHRLGRLDCRQTPYQWV